MSLFDLAKGISGPRKYRRVYHKPVIDKSLESEDVCSICNEGIQYCDKCGRYYHYGYGTVEGTYCKHIRQQFGM